MYRKTVQLVVLQYKWWPTIIVNSNRIAIVHLHLCFENFAISIISSHRNGMYVWCTNKLVHANDWFNFVKFIAAHVSLQSIKLNSNMSSQARKFWLLGLTQCLAFEVFRLSDTKYRFGEGGKKIANELKSFRAKKICYLRFVITRFALLI